MIYFLSSVIILLSFITTVLSGITIAESLLNMRIIDGGFILVDLVTDPVELDLLNRTIRDVVRHPGIRRKRGFLKFLDERVRELRPAPPSK